jgi:cell division protein FtsB
VTEIPEVLRRSWLALLLGGVAAVLLLSAVKGERGLARVLQLERELEQANDRNFHLVQEIDRMRRDLTMVRGDDGALERVARRHLGMVRPGEVLYRVRPRPGTTAGSADTDAGLR